MTPLRSYKQSPCDASPNSALAPRPSRASRLIPLVKALLGVLPSGLPVWLYTTLLSPAPLRRLTNRFLLRMIPEQVQIGAVKVVLNPADPVVSSALVLGIYEAGETRLIRERVRPGMRVLDIGANVGYYTALLADRVGPTGHVTAFEPEPGNHAVLCRTIEANGFGNVEVIQGAVSQSAGEGLLFLSELNQGDHRLYATANRRRITVPILALDSFLPAGAVIDFVKMDIQGSEGLALRGMCQTLRRSPDVQVITEFWPEGLARAGVAPLEFLQTLQDELGFTLWEVNDAGETRLPVSDLQSLIARNPGRCYTNLYCRRTTQAMKAAQR